MLRQLGKDYNSSLKEFLTELYDANEYVRDTKQGKFEIQRPAVSIIAASTIDWLLQNSKTDDFRSGFFSRFLFWPARAKNGWKGLGDNADTGMRSTLEYMLGEMKDLHGEARFSRPLIEKYNAWLREFEEEVNAQKLPSELQGFYTRLATYVLKFAVLHQIGQSLTLEITEQSLDYAIRTAEYLKGHLIALVEDEITVTGESRELKTIRQLIERESGIDRNTLLRRCKMTSDHLTKLTATLIESDQIRVEVAKGGGRPKQTYFAVREGEER